MNKMLERDRVIGDQVVIASQISYLHTQAKILARFRDELRDIVRKHSSNHPDIQEMKEKLSEFHALKIEWEKFEPDLGATSAWITSALCSKFPTLTPMEVRMCSLLRLHLKSHEIAQLFSISERSVETHRFNIRKKLKLTRQQSLSLFLNNF